MTSPKQESLEELVARKVQEYLAKGAATPLDEYVSKADMAALKKAKEDLDQEQIKYRMEGQEKELAFRRLQEELKQTRDARDTLRTDRGIYKGHADKLQHELVHARELLTEQGKTLARLKDQVAALQEHASRVYWLGQETGLDQAETLISQVSSEGISQGKIANIVHAIDGLRRQVLDNAEKGRPMPTITQAVEADRMEKEKADKESVSDSPAPAYRPTPEEAAELKKVTNAIGAAAASVLHTLLCGPTKEVQAAGFCSSSASTANDLDVRHKIDVLRDERDFLTWSAARLANVIRNLWTALSWEETRHSRGLLTTQANAMLAMLTDKAMQRDSDGRLIINWKNVLDPAHYGGTVSDGMKRWLESLWMTT